MPPSLPARPALRALSSAAAVLLSGNRGSGWANLALVSFTVLAQRVAFPVAALWLGTSGAAAAGVLVVAAAMSFLRALASERVARQVRSNFLELYLRPFESSPVMGLPSAEVVTTRLAVGFPALVNWAVEGLAALVAGAIALPIVVALLTHSLGTAILPPLVAAGAAGAVVMLVFSLRVQAAWNEAWERSRKLLMNVSARFQGALELRAHDRAHAAAEASRSDLERWSSSERRARWILAASRWGALGASIIAGGAVIAILPESPLSGAEGYRALLLVLAAIPTLQTLVTGVGHFLVAREELAQIAYQRLEGDRESVEEANEPIDPSAEVRLEDISYAYPCKPKQPVTALQNESLSLPAGASIILTGANGAGKSTLLYLLLGLIRPDQGQILVADRLARLDNPAWRKQVAFLSQQPFELHDQSVGANLRAFDEGATEADLRAALEKVGLWSLLRGRVERDEAVAELPYSALSRGQARRVLLARALLRKAGLIILDEPEQNLDAASVAELGGILRQLASSCRVIAAVHDPKLLDWATAVVQVSAPRRPGEPQ